MTEHTSDQGQFKAIRVYKAVLGPTICGETWYGWIIFSFCVKHLLHLSSYFASSANVSSGHFSQKMPKSSSQRIQKYLKLTTAVTVATMDHPTNWITD